MSTDDHTRTASRPPIEILGISGSLRARSSNTELLRAASSLAPANVRITLFSGLDSLPYFNPDLDGHDQVPPPAVRDFRERIRSADALLIRSPEYAHGVPGVLKNALDWLVSVPDVIYKPVGLLNASPRATHAQKSLAEILRTMCFTVIPAASIAVPVLGRADSAAVMVGDPELVAALTGVIEALVTAAARPQMTAGSDSNVPLPGFLASIPAVPSDRVRLRR